MKHVYPPRHPPSLDTADATPRQGEPGRVTPGDGTDRRIDTDRRQDTPRDEKAAPRRPADPRP